VRFRTEYAVPLMGSNDGFPRRVLSRKKGQGSFMKCVLRFDDYSATSNGVLERKLLEAVAEANRKIVVSVVPFVAGIGWELVCR